MKKEPRNLHTFLVWVDAELCIKLLASLFFQNRLDVDGILVNDVNGIFFLRLFVCHVK